MWVLGMILLFVFGAALAARIGWRTPRGLPAALIDIPKLSTSLTGIVGTLSGFTIASAIFLANLDTFRGSPSFGAVMGLFLIAFQILIATAIMFAIVPSLSSKTKQDDNAVQTQRILYSLSSTGFFLGLSLSWLGLIPLLQGLELDFLASLFSWLLLLALLAGGANLAIFLHTDLGAKLAAALAIPPLAFLSAGIFRLLAATSAPFLWPPRDAPLMFGITGYVLAAIGFSLQTAIVASFGRPAAQAFLRASGHRLLIVFVQATITAVALTWLSVVFP